MKELLIEILKDELGEIKSEELEICFNTEGNIEIKENRTFEINIKDKVESKDSFLSTKIKKLVENSKDIMYKKVDSEAIASLKYNQTTKDLFVEFHNSGIYKYSNIEFGIANDFFNADSKGKFYNKKIKRKYNSERITA